MIKFIIVALAIIGFIMTSAFLFPSVWAPFGHIPFTTIGVSFGRLCLLGIVYAGLKMKSK